MQRLLYQARWDPGEVDLRAWVVDPGAVLVADETGFVKKGAKSAGVQRQYTVGKQENCQVGVFLADAGPDGAVLVDRALYLPEAGLPHRARCRQAAIGDAVGFQTKPQPARAMPARALDAGVPVAWVTGEEADGGDARLRRWLEARQVPHVLAVKRTQHVIAMNLVPTPGPGPRRRAGCRHLADLERRRWCQGPPRVSDWAAIEIRPLREPGAGHWLRCRRSLDDGALADSAGSGPARATLAELVGVAGTRRTVECCLQQAKDQAGLDHYQVRRSDAWYRHATLAMLAHALLVVGRAREAVAAHPPRYGGQ
jgi:SRSO17 transposase